MLSKSYAAVQQFQSQISSFQTLQSLKNGAGTLDLSLSFQITSSSVWILNWDLTGEKISGTMELGLQPILAFGLERFETRPRTLRIEESSQIELCFFEARLLDLIKQSVLSLSEKSDG